MINNIMKAELMLKGEPIIVKYEDQAVCRRVAAWIIKNSGLFPFHPGNRVTCDYAVSCSV